jgi:AcrR family transcriptional regulator
MSQVAEETGIGRATLYKYFPDVEAILLAWHERHVAAHLEYLSGFANQPGVTAWARLVAVLDAYALIRHQHHDTDVAAFVHQDTPSAQPPPCAPRPPCTGWSRSSWPDYNRRHWRSALTLQARPRISDDGALARLAQGPLQVTGSRYCWFA